LAKFYFSSSAGNNTTGDGSINTPWQNFKGKKDGASALAPDDICYFKAGDTWTGVNAQVIVDSSGTSGHPIICDRYGSGNDPVFNGCAVTTGWTLHSGSIYKKTGQFSTIKTVGVDGTSALCYYSGTNTTLVAGTFRNESGTLYIRLADSSNPSGHTIYVPTFSHGSSADGGRGLISSGNHNTSGSYVEFNHMKCLYANGVGMSSSGLNNRFNDCTVIGSGQDGLLFYRDVVTGGTQENSAGSRAYRTTVQYCAAGGGGYGQGVTTYAPQTWFINCTIDHNFMAGIDFLDFDTKSNVTESGAIYCSIHDNGIWTSDASYDPQIYVDGAS